ncbi:hypothetical protein I7I50_03280 [Histoplasma capsulatum G186AR]|uniref:Uncharacterized protein n=1 Tax=Ajellomyces capsulatus TaxID=5037 RepID=A0A8H8D5G5_AJECA|nr:hypothetical protein I7I52_00051 [Histoplasma capsulatum]QSS72185.1 hypothetical protein I7I50_03280 [Histoplasma capsulatum G186AR]
MDHRYAAQCHFPPLARKPVCSYLHLKAESCRFPIGSLHSGLWTRGALVGFSWQRSQARQARRKLFVLTIKAPPLGTGWYVDRVVSLPVRSSICLLNLI